MGVSRYEDLQVWQRARALSNQIYEQTRGWPLAADRDLCQQLRTASVSIVANIAEGFLRRRDKEFIQFLRIAQASNGEVRALLYMAGDRTYLPPDVTKRLVEESNQIGRMLRKLQAYLQTSIAPARTKN